MKEIRLHVKMKKSAAYRDGFRAGRDNGLMEYRGEAWGAALMPAIHAYGRGFADGQRARSEEIDKRAKHRAGTTFRWQTSGSENIVCCCGCGGRGSRVEMGVATTDDNRVIFVCSARCEDRYLSGS